MRFLQLILCLSITAGTLHAQSWNWVKRFGGSGGDSGGRQAVDAVGNTYTCSHVSGTVNFGSGPVATNGSDMLVTKHNPGGNLVWYRLVGGTGTESSGHIVLDATGNIYVCGYFDGTMICAADTLTAVNDDIYVVKLNPAGQVVWGAQAGSAGSGLEYPAGAVYSAVDNSVVLCGQLGDSTLATFGALTVSGSQTFLAKIDASGNWTWAIGANPGENALAGDVVCESTGSMYVSTSVSAVLELQKYTSAGNQIWTQSASDVSFGSTMRIGASGDLYMIGSYNTPFTMGVVSMPMPSDTWGGFLMSFDTSGNALWGKDFQGNGVWLYGLALSPGNEIYIAGNFTNTFYTDTTFIADLYNDGQEGFIVKLNPAGSFRWFKQIGTTLNDGVSAVNYLAGKIYFCGHVEGTANGSFPFATLPAPYGNWDVIVGQFNDCSPPLTQVLPDSVVQVCEGDSIHLHSSVINSSYSYTWQINGVQTYNTTSPYLDVAGNSLYSGAYALQVTFNGCTYVSHYVNVFVYPLPTTSIFLTNYGPVCDRDSVKLTAGYMPLHNYQWLESNVPVPGGNSNNLMVHNSGNYSVVVTSPFGCVDTIANPPLSIGVYPVMTVTADTGVCSGLSLPLSASGATSYAWTPSTLLVGQYTANPTATPLNTTTYTVVGTTGSCRDTQYVVVQVYPLPVATASYNGYQLSSTPALTFQWYLNNAVDSGATTQVITPSGNGTYYCVVTDTNGCTDASNTVVVNNVGITEQGSAFLPLTVYPQPMKNEATILFPSELGNGALRVYDLTGQLVFSDVVANQSSYLFQRGALQSGVYMLVVESEGVVLRERIIAE